MKPAPGQDIVFTGLGIATRYTDISRKLYKVYKYGNFAHMF